jgi:hypothetical protein
MEEGTEFVQRFTGSRRNAAADHLLLPGLG